MPAREKIFIMGRTCTIDETLGIHKIDRTCAALALKELISSIKWGPILDVINSQQHLPGSLVDVLEASSSNHLGPCTP